MKNRITLVFLSMLFAGRMDAANAQVFSSDGQPAWSRVYQFMKSRFGSAHPNDAVLLLPSAVEVAWNNPKRVVRLYEMMQWGDLVPSDSWQYHSVSSKRVSDGYSLFLDIAYNRHLASSGSIAQAAKEAIKRASDEVNAARDAYNVEVKHADDAYILYLASNPQPPKNRDRYLKDQRYDTQIRSYKAKLDEAAANLRKVMDGIKDDPILKRLLEARKRFLNPKEQINLPPSLELLKKPDTWRRQYISTVEGNLSQGAGFKQDTEEASQTASNFDSTWRADVSVKFLGLVDVGHASAEEKKREEHMRSATTKITVEFGKVAAFRVRRGGWFVEGIIEQQSQELTPDERAMFFGPNGRLAIIPEELIVARGMKITIFTDNDSRDYIEHHLMASAGATFKLGYFSVGPSGSYSENSSNLQTHHFKDGLIIDENDKRSLVLAVVAKRYGTTPFAAHAWTLENVPESSDLLQSVQGTITPQEQKALERVP